MTLTAETRLGMLAMSLGRWCESQTYRSPKWIYGWNRTDFPDRYRFTVTVGGVPATAFEVTDDRSIPMVAPPSPVVDAYHSRPANGR